MSKAVADKLRKLAAPQKPAKTRELDLTGLPEFIRQAVPQFFPDATVSEAGSAVRNQRAVTFELSAPGRSLTLKFYNFKQDPATLKKTVMKFGARIEYELLRLYVQYHRSVVKGQPLKLMYWW